LGEGGGGETEHIFVNIYAALCRTKNESSFLREYGKE